MTNDEEPKRIVQPSHAWHKGFRAGQRSEPCGNPYPRLSNEAIAWSAGYSEGKAMPSVKRNSRENKAGSAGCL
jgi:hypothetical protein